MRLPNDVCRCTAKECPNAPSCARHEDVPIGAWVPCADLSGLMVQGQCPKFIPVEAMG